ncbi:MAG: efflux RND transporter permease subunit [Microscillaceae bacterium]
MSSLSQTSIFRPVLTIVMSITIILFGVIGFTYLGIREYPSIDPPIINVSTTYTGANADVVESQITEPLEEAINGVGGIRSLVSVSRDGRSTITVEFDLSVDLEVAANDVRDKVSQAVGNLPPDAEPPVVAKADADSEPVIFITIRSEKRPILDLTRIAKNVFKERFQTIDGVSEIYIWGEKRYSMRLWMNPARLSAYGLTPLDVQEALRRQNVELPTGRIEGNETELSIRTMGQISTPAQFNDLIIKQEGENIVRFSDIGKAELGAQNMRTSLKRDGVPCVGNAIVTQPGTNQVAIVDEVYARLEQIKKDLPRDIEVGIGFDQTIYVRASIKEVEETILTAFVLVTLVIFLFLRDWRTSFIPVITIPVSLIGTFFIMYLAGFSINVLTLLGIVLAIGLVVDDAIVMMENIYAKIEKGEAPLEAGVKGAMEIFFAVIATTIALVAVFLPIIFLSGQTGRLFVEFGVVIGGSVVISSFVALTLTPMLSSRILKRRERQNWFYRVSEPFFVWLNRGYAQSLLGFMKVRFIVWPLTIGLAILIYIWGTTLPSEVAPLEDRSLLRLSATGPEGATFEYMDVYMEQLIQYAQKEIPETEGIITVTSPGFGASSSVNSGFMRLRLTEPDKRQRTQREIAAQLSTDLPRFTDAKANVFQAPTIGGRRGGLPIEFVIQAGNLEKLKNVLPKFLEKAYQNPTFNFVDVNLKFTKPELQVSINREKAVKLNVAVIDIAQTLQFALSGQRFSYFTMDGKQYEVIGQLQREDRNKPADLKAIYVRNRAGQMIQLDNLVNVREESTPPQLFRYNRYLSATVSAGLAEGKTISEGIAAMEQIAKEVLDTSFTTALSGQSKDFQESSNSLYFAFSLALVLIYLVLAAQFESFRDPFIILITVPLAMAGALGSLWFFGQTLNIFSQIGIIMLIGLVSKNGILMVEFANQLKTQGYTVREAILEASSSRFRPILMTSLSTILGTLPIALALGAGSESRVSMGIAIVGGLVFSTLLTLYVVPAVYTYLTNRRGVLAQEKAA